MTKIYLVRFPNDRGPWSSGYGLAFGKPPTLMRLRANHHQ